MLYFDILNNITDNVVIHQALADPKKSRELTEFVQCIVRDKTSSLLRELASLHLEIKKLQRERIDNINAHAAEVQGLHNDYNLYTIKLKNALGKHVSDVV